MGIDIDGFILAMHRHAKQLV
ncbi:MAG: hypothetical protein Q621_VSBC00217G0002, partial [Veillonella sp. DORA_B_18_19_23]